MAARGAGVLEGPVFCSLLWSLCCCFGACSPVVCNAAFYANFVSVAWIASVRAKYVCLTRRVVTQLTNISINHQLLCSAPFSVQIRAPVP